MGLVHYAVLSLIQTGIGPVTDSTPGLAVTHVTVIDVERGSRLRDRTVVVAGHRIVTVGPSASTPIPPGTRIVPGRGRYLIPGLWDMHTHLVLYGELGLRLMIAAGVTGARDMGGFLDQLNGWRARIDSGGLIGPRIMRAGPTLDGVRFPGTIGAFRLVVATREDGHRVVDSLAALGVDLIKVHSYLSRDAYLGIAEEAVKRGIPFAGHDPVSIGVSEATAAGQRSIEHHFGLAFAAAPGGDSIRQWLADTFEVLRRAGAPSSAFVRLNFEADNAVTDRFVPGRDLAPYREMAARGTFSCPTLVTLRVVARVNEPAIVADPRLRYIPKALLAELDPGGEPVPHPGPADIARGRARFGRWLALVGDLHRAGVRFLAGTDMGVRAVFPGLSIPDELLLLTEAGLSPLEALQAATRNAALSLGILDRVGTIEAGKLADLVLLAGDPLRNIRATASVRAVIANGRLFADPATLLHQP